MDYHTRYVKQKEIMKRKAASPGWADRESRLPTGFFEELASVSTCLMQGMVKEEDGDVLPRLSKPFFCNVAQQQLDILSALLRAPVPEASIPDPPPFARSVCGSFVVYSCAARACSGVIVRPSANAAVKASSPNCMRACSIPRW
jgi:hypothetical protein